jgi:glycosyltransferase involved in cell wall biosynthesis
MNTPPFDASLGQLKVLFLDLRSRNLDLLPIEETHAGVLANALTDAGAQVTVVCSDRVRWDEVNSAARLISLRRGGLRRAVALVGQRVDLIVDVDLSGSVVALPFTRGRCARVVVVEDGPVPAGRANATGVEVALIRRLYRNSTVVVSSAGLRRSVRKQIGLGGPLHTVAGPLRLSGDVITRAERPTIVCLAPPVQRSKIDQVLRAIPLVVRAFPDVVVRILGDGAERQALERLAYALGIQATVRFDGAMPPTRQREVLASAWVAVDSLDSASAVRGAIRVGVPVVTKNGGAAAELTRAGGGYAFDSECDRGSALLDALCQVAQRNGEVLELKRLATPQTWAECRSRLLSIVSTEVKRRERRDQRRASDLTAVAEWDSDAADETAMVLQGRLRRTDQWRTDGRRFWALLHDCDEFDAMRVLANVDVREGHVRIAGRDDIVLARTTAQ